MRSRDWSSDVYSSDLLRDVLRGKVQLDTRLQDQSLGDALVIIAFEPTEQITLVAQEQGAFDLEQIGREPFEADRRIGPVRPLPEILANAGLRSEEHTSELQSLMRISYAVFCLKKKNTKTV